MAWLLRSVFLILAAFVVVCVIGFFLPRTQTIERSIEIDAYAEDVFPMLNDLTSYALWSPLSEALLDAQILYDGADEGVGQTMVWQNGQGDQGFGSQEILQSQPYEFVQTELNLSGQTLTATHAIWPREDGEGVIVLTKSETALGGFPYLSRVRSKLRSGSVNAEYDVALARLKTICENSEAPLNPLTDLRE